MDTCASLTTTYYQNTNYAPVSGSNWCPPTTGYYTQTTLSGQDYGALTSICDAQCNLYSPLCKAYIATDTLNYYSSEYDVVCSLYTTQLPAPTACFSDTPDDLYAAYRDDTNSCFSESSSDAQRFCSYALGKPNPSTVTDFTATVSPIFTSTSVSYVTKSVCVLPSGGRRNAAAYDDELPEATPAPTAPTNAAQQPQPTIAPRQLPVVPLQPRADSAPAPSCLNTVDYPAWNYQSACSCLSSVTAVTTMTDTTAAATTAVITRTRTTRVQKSSVPTFQPKVSVAGSSANVRYSLISREIKDKNGVARRVMIYSKPTRAADGQISMNISPDKNLFVVTQNKNNLKSIGRLTFVTTAANVPVLGQLPDGSNQSSSGDSLYNCAVGADNVISCKLKTGEAAVFSEVLVPGQKDRYFIAVGNKAMTGAKVVSLISTQTGTIIVGCGGTAP